jgi:hypothetical protein
MVAVHSGLPRECGDLQEGYIDLTFGRRLTIEDLKILQGIKPVAVAELSRNKRLLKTVVRMSPIGAVMLRDLLTKVLEESGVNKSLS